MKDCTQATRYLFYCLKFYIIGRFFLNKQPYFILIRYNIYGASNIETISTDFLPTENLTSFLHHLYFLYLLLLCDLNTVDFSFGTKLLLMIFTYFVSDLQQPIPSLGSLNSKSIYDWKRIFFFFAKGFFGVWKTNTKEIIPKNESCLVGNSRLRNAVCISHLLILPHGSGEMVS